MTISTLPTPPQRTDSPDQFVARADAFIAALPTFVTETNATAQTILISEAGLPITVASFTFSDTAGGDPGAGAFRWGNVSVASTATITISETKTGGTSVVPLLDFMDDSTSTASKGIVKFYKTGDDTKYAYFAISAVADNGSYRTLTCVGSASLSYSATAPFSNGDAVTLQWWPTGDAGSLAGGVAMTNASVTGIKEATWYQEVNNATTSGAVTIDWTAGHVQTQAAPTNAITYTFTPPTSSKPCHLQLRILQGSTAYTPTFPAAVKQVGATWAAANNKVGIVTFFFDGTSYWMTGANEV